MSKILLGIRLVVVRAKPSKKLNVKPQISTPVLSGRCALIPSLNSITVSSYEKNMGNTRCPLAIAYILYYIIFMNSGQQKSASE